jgi:hypothetical protein
MAEDFFCRSCSLGYGMDFGLCIAGGIWIWSLHCWSLGVEGCILAGSNSSIVSGGGGEYTLACSQNNSVPLQIR